MATFKNIQVMVEQLDSELDALTEDVLFGNVILSQDDKEMIQSGLLKSLENLRLVEKVIQRNLPPLASDR